MDAESFTRAPSIARAVAIVAFASALLFYYSRRLSSPVHGDARVPSEPGTRVKAAPGATGARKPSRTTARPSPPAPPAVSVPSGSTPHAFDEGVIEGEPGTFMISTPTLQEGYGWAKGLYALWAAESEDGAASGRAAAYLAEAMRSRRIEPRAYHVRCSHSLCRFRVRFRTSSELNRLSVIEPPPGVEYVTTFPQRLDDESLDVSVYWGRNGVSARRLMDERRAAAD